MTSALRRHARYLRFQYRSRFPKRVPEEDQPMSIDMGSDSRTLLIAFGGMRNRIGMPPFEFLALTGSIPVKRLFVRDLRQAWYHRGMAGHGDRLLDVADALRDLIAEHGVQRLIVTGNSAGAYAALIFGTLLGADEVLAFAPQTILDLDELGSMGDHRWDERLHELAADGGLDSEWIDLGRALQRIRAPDSRTRCRVFFDDSLEIDRLHAERLRGVEGLRLYRFGHGGHYLVRELRDCGALERLLRQAIEDESPSAASARRGAPER